MVGIGEVGVTRLAVVALELNSPLSQAICQVACSAEQIQSHLAEATRRGVEPIVCWPMSETAAAGLLRDEAPLIADRVLGPWPEDVIVLVCVSEAGVSLAHLPALPS